VTQLLRVERDRSHQEVWRLVLDDARRANALSRQLVDELQASLRAAWASAARCIVFESAGERFCSGFDLADIDRATDMALQQRFTATENLLESIRRAPALTVAAVRGAAFGAGADLVASCDYRLGTHASRFAFPGNRFGVVLGTRQLAAVVGRQRAREILIEGKVLDAGEAQRCGLLSEICADAELSARVDEILQRSKALDTATLKAILRLTRDAASELDMAELTLSLSREGLVDRLRAHAQRIGAERAARRQVTP
jgi:enoyl-CoA hydratase/carnithine racemase